MKPRYCGRLLECTQVATTGLILRHRLLEALLYDIISIMVTALSGIE